MNKAILMGRLTNKPELKQTPSGKFVTTFGLAVPRDFVRSGEERQTDFINVVAWEKTAEFCCNYFAKGTRIALVGKIQTRSWDGNDGSKRYATEVIAQEVHFADSKSEPAQNAPAQNENPQQETFYALPNDEEIPF